MQNADKLTLHVYIQIPWTAINLKLNNEQYTGSELLDMELLINAAR